MTSRQPLGRLLVERGVITQERPRRMRAMRTQHPLRLAALLSLLAYVGAALALLWRRPRAV